jgi:hypothetical protein
MIEDQTIEDQAIEDQTIEGGYASESLFDRRRKYLSVNCHYTMCRIHAAPYVTWLACRRTDSATWRHSGARLDSSADGVRYFCRLLRHHVACINTRRTPRSSTFLPVASCSKRFETRDNCRHAPELGAPVASKAEILDRYLIFGVLIVWLRPYIPESRCHVLLSADHAVRASARY